MDFTDTNTAAVLTYCGAAATSDVRDIDEARRDGVVTEIIKAAKEIGKRRCLPCLRSVIRIRETRCL